MGAKTVTKDIRVIVEVEMGWLEKPDDWEKKELYAKDIVSAIKRHVDGVSSVYVDEERETVCEFCGEEWTEGNSPHNGGCCDKDMEIMKDTPASHDAAFREASGYPLY